MPSSLEDDKKFTQELLESVGSLESLLGLTGGFFQHLLDEDDWSFIIKTHALLESGLTRLLEIAIVPPMPQTFISTLTLSGGRHSKLQLLRSLKLADADTANFVEGLSRIRNGLV